MKYTDFVKEQMKKRGNTPPKEYMKVIGEKWRKSKSKTMKGGHIHPMWRRKLEKAIDEVKRIKSIDPNMINDEEDEILQNAINFVRHHRTADYPASLNEIRPHLNRLERIIKKVKDMSGYEEEKTRI